MGVQLSLARETKTDWPTQIPQCRPMLVKKNDSETLDVAIRVGGSCVWFEPSGSSCGISYDNDLDFLKENYAFIRYLTGNDTVTFTGCEF